MRILDRLSTYLLLLAYVAGVPITVAGLVGENVTVTRFGFVTFLVGLLGAGVAVAAINIVAARSLLASKNEES